MVSFLSRLAHSGYLKQSGFGREIFWINEMPPKRHILQRCDHIIISYTAYIAMIEQEMVNYVVCVEGGGGGEGRIFGITKKFVGKTRYYIPYSNLF